jgi:hypothetical protein
MPWFDEPAGTAMQWAVELLYGDGERRYFNEWYDEDEARKEAEVQNLELLRNEAAPTGETVVVAYRAVCRQVTYGEWQ